MKEDVPKNTTPPYEELARKAEQLEGALSAYLLYHSVEREHLNQGLCRTEELLTSALESSDAGLWDWTVGDERIFFSASYYLMLGYAPFERPEPARPWIDYIHPEDDEPVRKKIREFTEDREEGFELEFRVRKKSGDYNWVMCRGRSVEWDERGNPVRLVGIIINITDKKRWEEALQESERRHATLLDSLPGMAYRCLNNGDWFMEFVSEGCIDLTGYTPEQLTGNRELYTSLIHPEDRADVWRQVESAIAKKQKYEMFYRIRSSAGDDRWVWEQGTGVFDEKGGLIAIEGFTSDVTAYKKVEQDLQKENIRLKAMMQRRHKFGRIVGKSEAMQKVYNLILDEIGEISLNMQVKLLRAIEGSGYTPIGGNEVKKPDVRIVAATNRNLKEQVRKGEMRQDFFFRIHIIPIRLPPLRDRRSDIPLLIYHFLQMFSDDANIATIPEDVIEAMQDHEWPGNVRELQNMVRRYLTLKKVDFIGSKSTEPPEPQTSPSPKPFICPMIRGSAALFRRLKRDKSRKY